jgi:mRNA interferase MazF
MKRRFVICDFGDVVVVPFPFVEMPSRKRRPSLILSYEHFNNSHGHSICAMITTAGRTKWPSDVAIEDSSLAGLNRPCVVRRKLFTLPNNFVLRRAGKLTKQDRERVVSAARNALA